MTSKQNLLRYASREERCLWQRRYRELKCLYQKQQIVLGEPWSTVIVTAANCVHGPQ